MDVLTAVVGVVLVIVGGGFTVARSRTPDRLRKFTNMRKAFGERAGTLIHVISYSIIPVILGLVLIVLAARGYSLFSG